MPRPQNRKCHNRYQRKLEDSQLNAESMKLVGLIHRSSGRHDTGTDIWRLMKVCSVLTQKVGNSLEKL